MNDSINYRGLLQDLIKKYDKRIDSLSPIVITKASNGGFECEVEVTPFGNFPGEIFRSKSFSATKKKAEKEACYYAYLKLSSQELVTTSSNILHTSSSNTNNVNNANENRKALACATCHAILVSYNQLMLYYKTAVDISLVIKPEELSKIIDCNGSTISFEKSVDSLDNFSNGTYNCANCRQYLAVSTKFFVPDTSIWICCFKAQSVNQAILQVDSMAYVYRPFSSGNWRKLIAKETNELRGIESRDNLGVLDALKKVLAIPIATKKNIISTTLSDGQRIDFVFDRENKSFYENLDVPELLRIPFKPRREQFEIFGYSLLYNLIAVLPTGSGKTLIAVLLMSQYIRLNPNKIAVMIVGSSHHYIISLSLSLLERPQTFS